MSKLALLGGTPVSATCLARPWPSFDDRERQGLLAVLESRAWGGYPEPSPVAARFAENFARHHGATAGVCVTNGSVTLEVALLALGIEAGDEVIVPTYTWIATGVAPIHQNAVPVFVDVLPGTYCMDPDQVEAAITPRTKGIITVHLGSQAADLDRLTAIAQKHGLFLIEDCAHAHGGAWRGKGLGSWGDFGSFSFQVSKLMTAGEGGIVTTSSAELEARAHWIVNCGRKEKAYEGFAGNVLGVNGRMTEFQAAILEAQLARLADDTAHRERSVAYLDEQLTALGGLVPLARDERQTSRHAYQLLLRYDAEQFAGVHRNRFLAALEAEGVDLDGAFYVPMHEHQLMWAETRHWPALRERYGDGIKSPLAKNSLSFPVTSKAAYHEAVWMHYPYLMGTRDDLDRIVEAVAKVKQHAADLL